MLWNEDLKDWVRYTLTIMLVAVLTISSVICEKLLWGLYGEISQGEQAVASLVLPMSIFFYLVVLRIKNDFDEKGWVRVLCGLVFALDIILVCRFIFLLVTAIIADIQPLLSA